MRLRAFLFVVITLAGTGLGAWKIAQATADYVEQDASSQIAQALKEADLGWARVEVNGLLVAVTGKADTESVRFRTLEIIRQVVDPRRIRDLTTLRVPDALTAPPFALEMLRNEAEVSLIGLVPVLAGPDRLTSEAIRDSLAAVGLDGVAMHMVETTDDPAPDGWNESLRFGLRILADLPRAKVSVSAGNVLIKAVTDSAEERQKLEADLRTSVPEGVTVETDLSAPRPVFAPYVMDYNYDGKTGWFTSCHAARDADADQILAAATQVGYDGGATCEIGLGAPDGDWADVVTQGIAALDRLGGGRFVVSDTHAGLTGPAGIEPAVLNAEGLNLRKILPERYRLMIAMPPTMEVGPDGEMRYVPRFDAVLSGDGMLRLSGAVQDQTSHQAISSYAAALFGHDRITDDLIIDPALPEGWPVRVLAGIDALHGIKEGTLTVTSQDLALAGLGLSEDTGQKIRSDLLAKVHQASVDIRFDAEAARLEALKAEQAGMSRPQVCAGQIAAILDAGSIRFRAGSTEIDAESLGVISAIADVLITCPGAEFEVAGHTDSQGSAQGNLRLSQERAQAVIQALEQSQDLSLLDLHASGYGSEYPVADNATNQGREQNRRIEITLRTTSDDSITPEHDTETGPALLSGEACARGLGEILDANAIQFAPGSSEIADESRAVLSNVAEMLRSCPGTAFEIGGHTDNSGRVSVNQRISQQRADAVLAALQAADLASIVLTAKGYGPDQPIADNTTPDGRRLNRRIELTLVSSAPEPNPEELASLPGVDDEARVSGAEVQGCVSTINGLLAEGSILFGLNSSTISSESQGLIKQIGQALKTCPGTQFEVGGHTDIRGPQASNLALSERRAQSVVAALEAMDIGEVTLSARGYGPDRPIADNDTREGRAKNRRIELALLTSAEAGSDTTEANSAMTEAVGGSE